MNGNAYSDIKDLINASEAWKFLEKNFKLRGSGFLKDTFQKLDDLILNSCKSPADYVSQFRSIVNELRKFSTKLKLDESWLIFCFHPNLGLVTVSSTPFTLKHMLKSMIHSTRTEKPNSLSARLCIVFKTLSKTLALRSQINQRPLSLEALQPICRRKRLVLYQSHSGNHLNELTPIP